MKVLVHSLVKNLDLTAVSKSLMEAATTTDSCLIVLQQLTQSGWPSERRRVIEAAAPYCKVRDQVHEAEGLILMQQKFIVSESMRDEMLPLLQESHQGIEKGKARARLIMYWPIASRDVMWGYNHPPHQVCRVARKQSKGATYSPWSSWHKLGAHILELRGKDCLCVVDYSFKFPEISLLSS